MRPITTHINILVAGGSGLGKTTFIQALAEGLGVDYDTQIPLPAFKLYLDTEEGTPAPTDEPAVKGPTSTKQARPDAAASPEESATLTSSSPAAAAAAGGCPRASCTRLDPIVVADAGRELVLTLQVGA
jgi:hypothetical protein